MKVPFPLSLRRNLCAGEIFALWAKRRCAINLLYSFAALKGDTISLLFMPTRSGGMEIHLEKIYTDSAPLAIGPYSQAIKWGGFVFTSGQLGITATGKLAEGIENQTRQAIVNAGEILTAAGVSYEDVIKTTCFLKNMSDFAVFNEIYGKYFTGKPARSCVEVSALPKGALVEIEVTAACR